MSNDDLPHWANRETAVALLEAYRRILAGNARTAKASARITFSLVATEAGYQRSTLNKKNFPDLWAMIHKKKGKAKSKSTTAAQKIAQKARANRELAQRIQALSVRNSKLQSLYISLGKAYLELWEHARMLSEQSGIKNKVVPIKFLK